MPRETFDQELAELGALLNEEARLCQRSLDGALEALIAPESNAADTVVAGDDGVDRVYLQVEHGVESLLARQSPVAVDLRFVLAVIHVNQNLERIGDQCVNIAKLLPITGNEPPVDDRILEMVERMGALARSEVSQSKQAFLLRDADLAEDLVRQDEQINQLNKECFRRAVEIGNNSDVREWAMTMMLISRAIERIGDNAVDIGEQVAFVVTGLFREFSDASHT